ncbi:MAG: hypothetical protein AUJ36_00080 [Parcubacteria group bacterium CG1_02_41_26]|nr:MAG: hypothetical protein AUJ36_00080 [Parcubacteria group bacterium CG1_02_41_26]
MVREMIRVVTVTGVDDSVRPEELIPIAERYPFVEFGVLLSQKQQGGHRFPSRNWLAELYILWRQEKERVTLSGHLCGEWVQDLCLGEPSFFKDFGYTWEMFKRFQLNFHAKPHLTDSGKLYEIIRKQFAYKPVIFQMDGTNDEIFYSLEARCQVFPLFDQSGGIGLVPKAWPKQYPATYCGYAGGLSPANLQKEMGRISEVADGTIWIDAKTSLRSGDNKVFRIETVCRFLEAAMPWVKHWW